MSRPSLIARSSCELLPSHESFCKVFSLLGTPTYPEDDGCDDGSPLSLVDRSLVARLASEEVKETSMKVGKHLIRNIHCKVKW